LLLLSLVTPCAARAQSPFAEPSVELHGFASQGFVYTTDNQFLVRSKGGSFEFAEVGLNFTVLPSDKLRVGIQLFAQDRGPFGNYRPTIDWFYLDYRFFDWLGLRAGRTKVPSGLYNETRDIDAARAPILLPQALYPLQDREILLAQTGVDAYGHIRIGPLGAIDYNAFLGTISYEPPWPQPELEHSVPYTMGARVQWFTPLDGLLLAFTAARLRVDQTATLSPAEIETLKAAGVVPPNFTSPLRVRYPISAWTASIEYSANDVLLAAEYSQARTGLESPGTDFATLVPEPVRARYYYVMGSYRVAPWFTPGAYYSFSHPNVERKGRTDATLHDVAVFVRYDLTANWLFKLEAHHMTGTATLDFRLNGLAREDDLRNLTRVWGAFLAKTTAHF